MELSLDTRTFLITSETGNLYTPAQARRRVEQGYVKDMNLAFRRLIRCNYDLERVKKEYADLDVDQNGKVY